VQRHRGEYGRLRGGQRRGPAGRVHVDADLNQPGHSDRRGRLDRGERVAADHVQVRVRVEDR
jgi:hypothetical protein